MPLPKCPTCNSADVRTLAAAYVAGTTNFQSTSVYIGSKGNRGVVPGFGTTRTLQASLLRPPKKKDWTIVGWFVPFFVVVFFVSLFSDSEVGNDFIFATAVSVVLTSFCSIWHYEKARQHNESVYPEEMGRWERSFVCDRCTTVFEVSRQRHTQVMISESTPRSDEGELSLLHASSGQMLLTSSISPSDMELGDLLTSAKQGNVEAQFELGQRFEFGTNGMPQNQTEAAKCYRMAAEQGHAEAQACLGALLWYGEGIEHNLPEAVTWTRRAVDGGSKKAERNLGLMYEYGEGADQDYAEAARLYRPAAEREDPPAQSYLGSLYERGLGVPLNLTEAAVWYSRAEKHSALAKEGLARVLSKAEATQDPQDSNTQIES